MDAVTWFGFAALPIIVGLVQAAKGMFAFPSRWGGGLSILLGIALGLASATNGGIDLATGAMQGLVIGLAAAGLWSTTKAGVGR